jgi:hypothetical protein
MAFAAAVTTLAAATRALYPTVESANLIINFRTPSAEPQSVPVVGPDD